MRLIARLSALALPAVLLGACTQTGSAFPSSSSRATATATAGPTPIALSDAMISAPDSQPFFLFQAPPDGRLRGLSWDGAANGLFTRSGTLGLSSQAPDGRYAVINGSVFDRHGDLLGSFPWPGKDPSVTWAPDSSLMCRAVPSSPVTGSSMTLQTAIPGHPPQTIARGYATYSDSATFPVLACNPKKDRAIVAEFGQGVAPSEIWIMQLSTNAVLRTITSPGASVAASPDANLLALSAFPATDTATWRTSIQSTDDGKLLGKVNDLEAHGFTGDGSLLIGLGGPKQLPVVVDWQKGKRIWAPSSGRYFGYLAEPDGSHLVVGMGTPDGYLGDAYLVGPTGVVLQLPSGIAAALRP